MMPIDDFYFFDGDFEVVGYKLEDSFVGLVFFGFFFDRDYQLICGLDFDCLFFGSGGDSYFYVHI